MCGRGARTRRSFGVSERRREAGQRRRLKPYLRSADLSCDAIGLDRSQPAVCSPRLSPPPPVQPAAPPKPAEPPRPAAELQRESIAKQKEAIRIQAKATGVWLVPGASAPQAPCDPIDSVVVNPIIDSAAKAHQLDPTLVRAVIEQESAFKPCAVSAQRRPGTHATHARDRRGSRRGGPVRSPAKYRCRRQIPQAIDR